MFYHHHRLRDRTVILELKTRAAEGQVFNGLSALRGKDPKPLMNCPEDGAGGPARCCSLSLVKLPRDKKRTTRDVATTLLTAKKLCPPDKGSIVNTFLRIKKKGEGIKLYDAVGPL